MTVERRKVSAVSGHRIREIDIGAVLVGVGRFNPID
jgi:hypothetical protein